MVEPTGWESRIEQVTVTDLWDTPRQRRKVEMFREHLDELGRSGWELVEYSVSSHAVPVEGSLASAETHLAVLKRPSGRVPIPEPAGLSAERERADSGEIWISAETREALVTRWREACDPCTDEIEQLLDAQQFLPEDDWSLIVPCRDANSPLEGSQALLAVGSSWWILVEYSAGHGRFRVGDLSTLTGISQKGDSMALRDDSGTGEDLVFATERTATRTADFVRARREALSAP